MVGPLKKPSPENAHKLIIYAMTKHSHSVSVADNYIYGGARHLVTTPPEVERKEGTNMKDDLRQFELKLKALSDQVDFLYKSTIALGVLLIIDVIIDIFIR